MQQSDIFHAAKPFVYISKSITLDTILKCIYVDQVGLNHVIKLVCQIFLKLIK